jgi:outer membrane lipoprotein-sorting protein
MSIFTSRPAARWAAPAIAAVAVVGAGVAAKTLAVAAEPDLAPRSAAQLLVDLQTASLDGLSGTVVERADLGLPAITSMLGNLAAPGANGVAGPGSANLTSLISGKHTMRVWYSGPDKARVALVGTDGESDVIRNGNDVWVWDSKANTAAHHVFTGKEKAGAPKDLPKDLPGNLPKTPQEAADLALKAIDPTTVVSTGSSAKIAGRNAYELILSPRDTSSLIGQVRLAIDAKQHVPLRVQILPKGSSQPAVEVGFTQVSFARPDNAQFTFTPPAGTKVTEATPDKAGAAPGTPGKPGQPGRPGTPNKPADQGKSTVIGKGWAAVYVARAGANESTDAAKSPEAQSLLNQLPKGANGSRVLTSRLFSVLLTDDGRILFGAVSPQRLAQVAADPAAQLK